MVRMHVAVRPLQKNPLKTKTPSSYTVPRPHAKCGPQVGASAPDSTTSKHSARPATRPTRMQNPTKPYIVPPTPC